MSSALLYLAIVVIWAGVLVPRWLRPPAAPPHPAESAAPPRPAESDTGMIPADAGVDQPETGMNAGEPWTSQPETGMNAGEPWTSQPETGMNAAKSRPGAAEVPGGRRAEPVPALSAAQRQARILRARRRTLAILTLLTTGAAGLAVTHLAAVWIIIPPSIMLAGFLVLLREAARTDAERTHRHARATKASARGGKASARGGAGQNEKAAGVIRDPGEARVQEGRRARPTPAAAAAGQDTGMPAEHRLTAQIIDISGRVGDQLYDQYTDAADRAVGD